MPRRGGGGFGGNRGSSRSRTTSQSPPRPAPTFTQSQPVPHQRGGLMSGLAGTMMTGMAFGAGSEIAHQGVRGLMGGGSHGQQAPADNQQAQPQQAQQQPAYCSDETQSFIECLKKNSEISYCQMYSDALKECQKKYGMN